MRLFHLSGLLVAVFAAALFGCNPLEESTGQTRLEKERWNSANSPTRFRGIELKTELEGLPTSGRSDREIWPSSYWPTHRDSINYRWRTGEMSPAEKYDQAFNGWEPPEGFMELKPYRSGSDCKGFDPSYYEKLGPLANHISSRMGNKRARDGIDNDDDGETDECDDRDGVEKWFGLCHAWVPAAMLEDRPFHSVTYNGVTFHTADVEALTIAAYNRASADMIGGRCNDKEVKRDEQGRAEDVRCRDTNPGTLHLIMTNYVGINKIAFAEDRTYNYEVWNQPVVAFDVTSLDEVTLQQAAEAVGQPVPATEEGEDPLPIKEYIHNPDARFFYKVAATLTYITESDESDEPAEQSRYERRDSYTYILELDEEKKIIGGEWTGNSRRKHPDFLWNPRRAYASSVPNLDLNHVRKLISLAREPLGPEMPAETEPVEFKADVPVVIPDNDVGGMTIDLVVGSGLQGAVDLVVNVEHGSVVDLMIGLISPSGETWEVLAQGSGTGEDFGIQMRLDPVPVGDLGGTWKLAISDRLQNHSGRVTNFLLKVTPTTD